MIKGVGVDIVEIERIREAVEKYGDAFLKKVYSKREIGYCTRRKIYRYPELAVRFAAKEAYSKALGVGLAGFGRSRRGLKLTDIEVVNDKRGKPLIAYRSKLKKAVHVSLSHSRDNAIAFVYVEE